MSPLASLRSILAFFAAAVATSTIVPNIRADILESATAGSNVTLVASADGNPAPTFIWLKNGVAIPGATSATLVIPSVTTASNGVYNAVASNASGWAMSDDVVLTVTPKGTAPFFTVQPYPTSVAPTGSALTLSATAIGTPTPTYQWRKSGSPIAGATKSTLTFNSLSVIDGGVYSVVAANSAGSITSANSILKVTAAAPITAPAPAPTPAPQPEATPTPAPAPAPSPTPAPTPTPSPTPTPTPSAAPAPTPTPTPEPAPAPAPAPAPEPKYTAPVYILQPQSQSGLVKGSVTFSVAVSGTPAPTLQWYKDGVAIAGATGTSYTISAVFSSHAGTYTVVATNSAGAVTSDEAVLTVRFK